MLEWILAIAGFVLFLLILPRLLARAKAGSRKGGGFVVGLGMILATAFDPARSAAVEEVDRSKDIRPGDEESGGTPL